MTLERRCYVCLAHIPETKGIYDAERHALICSDPCNARANAERRIYDRSRRGRWRPLAAWKRRLISMRPWDVEVTR